MAQARKSTYVAEVQTDGPEDDVEGGPTEEPPCLPSTSQGPQSPKESTVIGPQSPKESTVIGPQSPKESIVIGYRETQQEIFEYSSDSTSKSSRSNDSDLCCIDFIRRKRSKKNKPHNTYMPASSPLPPRQTPQRVSSPPREIVWHRRDEQRSLQVPEIWETPPSPTSNRTLLRQRRMANFRRSQIGLELSLDSIPQRPSSQLIDVPSGSQSVAKLTDTEPSSQPLARPSTKQSRGDSFRSRAQSVPTLVSPPEQWPSQIPCSCMEPGRTPQRPGQSQRPATQPTHPLSNMPTMLPVRLNIFPQLFNTLRYGHPAYICHDIAYCRDCYMMYLTQQPVRRHCLQLTGFPISHPQITFGWLVYFGSQFEGFKSVYLSPYRSDIAYTEYFTAQNAQNAMRGLNGLAMTTEHILRASLVAPPMVPVETQGKLETLV